MLPRFVQLFLLASIILLVPSLLYLSHAPSSTYIDPKTGLAYSSDSIPAGVNPLSNHNPLAQTSQGDGVDSSAAHKWSGGWTWAGVNGNDVIRKPVEKIEGTWKGWIDNWKSLGKETSRTPQSGVIEAPNETKAVVAADEGPDRANDAAKQTAGRIDGNMMPVMTNATAKVALGRATWHFLHTMTLRFPDKPTKEQRQTLKTFFEMFGRLYPCHSCAEHFRQLMQELPPQTGSRMNASLWLCVLHNKVNERLGKPEFPCDKLDESYDCGCGDETKGSGNSTATASSTASASDATQSLTPLHLTRRQEQLQEGVRALARRALDFRSNSSSDGEAQRWAKRATEDCLCRVR